MQYFNKCNTINNVINNNKRYIVVPIYQLNPYTSQQSSKSETEAFFSHGLL